MERIEKSYEQLLKGEDDIQKAQKNLNLNQKSFNEKDNMNSSIKLSSIQEDKRELTRDDQDSIHTKKSVQNL